MKICYIAHPISGDVTGNLEKIREIVRYVNLTRPDVVPFVPYYVDCVAMDDNNSYERERGIKNGKAVLQSGIVHELWLYGDKISDGVLDEILICREKNIPVVPQTDETKYAYENYFNNARRIL